MRVLFIVKGLTVAAAGLIINIVVVRLAMVAGKAGRKGQEMFVRFVFDSIRSLVCECIHSFFNYP
jgi:hypothetical protein